MNQTLIPEHLTRKRNGLVPMLSGPGNWGLEAGPGNSRDIALKERSSIEAHQSWGPAEKSIMPP